MAVIVTRNLTKIYKTGSSRISALNNVSLSVREGEFVALVGTSGSGKSTLLNLLAGLEPPSSGKIIALGQAIHRMNEKQLVQFRKENVGFIFQAYNLMPTMTALENAAFSLTCQGVKRTEREKRAAELLTAMGLKEHLHHKPSELSGGQQQRVSIARALIVKPKIVFADEPTGNLDSKTASQIMDLLRDTIKQNQTTMLLVTHDMEKAAFADRIIRISDGVIDETDTVSLEPADTAV